MTLVTREVTVFDASEQPIGTKSIYRRCKRCERHAATTTKHVFWEVASPGGTEHLARTLGRTHCGIDATGDGWWWQL